jgi:GntR family transcriptional regulator/MocR family aminotransferase
VLEIRNWAADMVDRDDPLLIEQIQARLLPRRGIFANPDEIIVTLGAQNALYMLATLLMAKGMKVAMEDPGYPDARSIFRLAGAEVHGVPVDNDGIVTSSIPDDARFVFVTPSHHCPTMVPLSTERRQDLLSRAARNSQIIIEDGYDSQLIDEAPQQALKSLDRSGRVIYVGSMSKTLAPGLRMGYIVAPAELVAELRALRRFMLRHPPANNQRAVALFLSLGASVWRRQSARSCRNGIRRIRPAAPRSGWRDRAGSMPAGLPRPRPRAASSSSRATASSTGHRSRHASCGSESRRSRSSISSRESGSWRPRRDGDRQPPELSYSLERVQRNDRCLDRRSFPGRNRRPTGTALHRTRSRSRRIRAI